MVWSSRDHGSGRSIRAYQSKRDSGDDVLLNPQLTSFGELMAYHSKQMKCLWKRKRGTWISSMEMGNREEGNEIV